MIDMRYSLPEICCESQHLSIGIHLCLNYSSQTASTLGTSSHSSQAHMVLLVYMFAYLFPSLLLEKESCYKDKNGLNLPSVCSSLPSAEIPGCISNQVFASQHHLLGETVPDSLLKKCQDIPTAGISYPLVRLFWNLLCRTLSSSKIHFHPYQGLVNSRQTFNHLIMFHVFCMDVCVSAEGHVEQYLAHQFSQHTVCPLGEVVYASLGFHLYSAAQGREGNRYIRNFSFIVVSSF